MQIKEQKLRLKHIKYNYGIIEQTWETNLNPRYRNLKKTFLVFKLAKVAQKIKKYNTQNYLHIALPKILVPKMGDDLDRNQPMAVKGVATDR